MRGYQTCAIIGGGNLRCWGSDYTGQLGDNDTVAKKVPTPLKW
jgi:hypothetical protein